MVSVWVDEENFNDFVKGHDVYGSSIANEKQMIQLLVKNGEVLKTIWNENGFYDILITKYD